MREPRWRNEKDKEEKEVLYIMYRINKFRYFCDPQLLLSKILNPFVINLLSAHVQQLTNPLGFEPGVHHVEDGWNWPFKLGNKVFYTYT